MAVNVKRMTNFVLYRNRPTTLRYKRVWKKSLAHDKILSLKAKRILLYRFASEDNPTLSQEEFWDNPQVCPRCYRYQDMSLEMIAYYEQERPKQRYSYSSDEIGLDEVHQNYRCEMKFCQHEYHRIEDWSW